VVVPLWSPLPGRAIRAGSFGLIQQFGVGVDNIDLNAAADEGVRHQLSDVIAGSSLPSGDPG
jgi:phosphoglycerate dehydrogenase-like enzyme